MKRFTLRVLAVVDVEAMEFEDAVEALEDRIGLSSDDDLVQVQDLEVYDLTEED